jgi:hypothetical protein
MLGPSILGKPRRRPPGVSVYLLQRRLERFTDARLDRAMQHAWNKEYDPREFFSVAIPQNRGAMIRAFGAEISVQHHDYPLDAIRLGDIELPFWAQHAAYSDVEYICPQGVPEDKRRLQMYRGLAMLCAELASEATAAFLFPAEQVLVPNSEAVARSFRAKGPLDPFALEALLDDE